MTEAKLTAEELIKNVRDASTAYATARKENDEKIAALSEELKRRQYGDHKDLDEKRAALDKAETALHVRIYGEEGQPPPRMR